MNGLNLRGSRWILIGALGLCTVLTAHAPALGQQQQLERFERRLERIRRLDRLEIEREVPAEQRALIDYGAYASFYFLGIDDTRGNTRILRQTDLNAYLRMNVDNVHRVFIRGRVAYEDFNNGDSFDGEGDEWIGPNLERAFYEFDLANYLAAYEGQASDDYNLRVRGGRQLVHWANGLVLSRELDGAVVTNQFGDLAIDVLGGRTREEQVDLDPFRPDFDEDANRNFYGGRLSYEIAPGHRPYLYGVMQKDHNPNRTFAGTNFHYDSWYIGLGSEGVIGDRFRYGVEFAWEGGEGLSDGLRGPQQVEDIEAWALDIQGDYLFNDSANTRLSGELLLASGDDDRNLHTTSAFGGNQPGTTDEAFNAFGLLHTGLSFSPAASNLLMVRGGASAYPFHGTETFKRLQLGFDLFAFNKMDSDAPIDEPTRAGERFLGVESDFYANWQVTSDLAWSVRYGVFFPNDDAIVSDDDPRHFVFSGVTLGF